MWYQFNVMCDNGKEFWIICVHSEDWLLRDRLDKHAQIQKVVSVGVQLFFVDEGIQIPLKACK